MRETIDILSWNVNGLRAAAGKGFVDWLAGCGADIVGIQEVRAELGQLDEAVRAPAGWQFALSSAAKKGYSGVGIYSRARPDELITSLDNPEMDAEGRVQIARFGRLTVANIYFPNGSGSNRSNDRVPFKLAFYRRLFDVLAPRLAAGEAVVVMGDFNTAHRELDLARPKANVGTSGFLPDEREELDRWLRAGWVDSFRLLYPERAEVYSWWSQRFGVREKNIGWRIDYCLLSPAAAERLVDAFVHTHILGSDHCPVGVRLDAAVC
jgi:exodeoxyribonuclease-3